MTRKASGFSLIELAVVLVLVTILMGLVIARFAWGGPRQQVISAARALGNGIERFREKAMLEETLYALRLDLDFGEYAFLKPAERSLAAIEKAEVIRKAKLPDELHFSAVRSEHKKASSPIVVFFSRRGVIPDLEIELEGANEERVLLKVNSFANEISYEER